jgi:hypothetical protein
MKEETTIMGFWEGGRCEYYNWIPASTPARRSASSLCGPLTTTAEEARRVDAGMAGRLVQMQSPNNYRVLTFLSPPSPWPSPPSDGGEGGLL